MRDIRVHVVAKKKQLYINKIFYLEFSTNARIICP